MKNYTLDILSVLAEWLKEKGWDVGEVHVEERLDGIFVIVHQVTQRGPCVISRTKQRFDFTQLNLCRNDILDRPPGEVRRVLRYIRAELERQVGE